MEDMGLMNTSKVLIFAESRGAVNYDPEADEMYCSADVDTFCRLAPDVSEKKLEDLHYLQLDLDIQTAHAAKRLMETQHLVA
jgi:hypothetical protein